MLFTRNTREADRHTQDKGWNKIYWASTDKKKAGVAIMISEKKSK